MISKTFATLSLAFFAGAQTVHAALDVAVSLPMKETCSDAQNLKIDALIADAVAGAGETHNSHALVFENGLPVDFTALVPGGGFDGGRHLSECDHACAVMW